METLWQDLRYGVRMLMKTPGFTVIAVISLALGIGANTALFSVADALLLRLLPVKEPDRLVLFKSISPREFSPGIYSGIWDRDPVTGQNVMTSFAYQSYQRMREQQDGQRGLSDIFAFGDVTLNVNSDGQADVANGQAVSGNYYVALGVQALLGRTLVDGDDQAGASPVAVLSHRYWQNHFGSDAAVIGKQIKLNKVAFTVIGVTPPGFEGTGQVGSTQDVTFPRVLATDRLFARLMTLFGLLAQRLAAIGLFGVLAYSVSQRTREIGIRMALGADRRNKLKMILRQGMTLALLGVGLGLIGAYGLTKYLENQMGLSQMLYGVKVFDPLSYGVVAVLVILMALLACFIPAQRATKVDPLLALRCD